MNESLLRSRVARLRSEVDALDVQLLEGLAQRNAIVRELAGHKPALGIPPCDATRESEMAELHAHWAEQLDLPQQLVSDLFDAVLRSSRELQASCAATWLT